jgi:hypothetical protein
MVRMDNLSAAMLTSRFFAGFFSGFYWIYPAPSLPTRGVAEWIIFGWRFPSESGGDINRNQVPE